MTSGQLLVISNAKELRKESVMQRLLHKPVVWVLALVAVTILAVVFVALYAGGGGGGGGY
jgi:hypothetical protein